MNLRLSCISFALLLPLSAQAQAVSPRPVKVMVVSMFGPEGSEWLRNRAMNDRIPVPGLPADYPVVRCDAFAVCQATIGMGFANAAASIAALIYSGRFDLRRTYWLVSGIAGIDPAAGTLGTVTLPRFVIDGGLQWELDAREKPSNWSSGYLGIGAHSPDEKPTIIYGTEVFKLNQRLVDFAMTSTRGVQLADSHSAQQTRAHFRALASQEPTVISCDTVSDDTWISGALLSRSMDHWARLLTNGAANACTTQQEDTATLAVLARARAAALADDRRVLIMRAGSDFSSGSSLGSDKSNLLNFESEGGTGPAVANLFRTGNLIVNAIVSDWDAWKDGVPESPPRD